MFTLCMIFKAHQYFILGYRNIITFNLNYQREAKNDK
jgi:hypothetical protein